MSYILNPALRTYDDSWPEHWPAWVIQICSELETVERRFPSDLLHETPLWVDKMGLRIIQCLYPTTEMEPEVSGASFLGSIAGHFTWLIDSPDGWPALVKRYEEASEKIVSELEKTLGEDEYNKLVNRLEKDGTLAEVSKMTRSLYRIILRKRKVLEKCFQTIREKSLTDQADFHAAYGHALKTPPLDKIGALVMEKSTGVSSIYLIMVLNWKSVKNFTSAVQCYRWLCKLLGKTIVGNEERIQKMCFRFGVNFSRHKRNKRKVKRKYRTRW